MTDITLLGGTSATAVTMVFVEVAKRAGVPAKYLPFASVVLGAIVMCLGTWSFSVGNILTGIVIGAVASGVWDFGKSTVKTISGQ